MSDRDAGLTGWRFRVRWVLASAAGMAVAGTVARPLSYLAGGAAHRALGEVLGEAVVGAVAGGGVLGGVALAQWPLLRGRVSWAGRWPAAFLAAGAAGAVAAFVVLRALTLAGNEVAGVVAAVALGFAAFVRAQWWVLRRRVPRAAWLAVMSAGGFLAAAALTAAVGTAFGGEGGNALFGALLGAGYGAITVLALGRLSPAAG